MIFGKEINWYLQIILKPLLITIGIIFFSDLLSLLPLIGWIFALMTGMFIRLIKLAVAGWLGYQVVKEKKASYNQVLTLGSLFGLGIGLASITTNFLKIIIRPNLTSLFFSSLSWFFLIISEIIICLIVSFIGAVLSNNINNNKKEVKNG